MRIIAGSLKGRRLPAFKMAVRPTTDFGKEALFNLIEHKAMIADCSFLDLFSGTGSISYEFISRGAAKGLCVDMSAKTQAYRLKCIKQLEIENLVSIRRDVFKFLGKCNEQFDIIFADPPYQLKEVTLIPDLIYDNNLLKENGLLIVEHSKEIDFSKHPHFDESRNYSAVHLSFFR